MIITRRHLPRRLFLKGMGAAIALPALDAMTPAFAASPPGLGGNPTRLAFTYVPNGVTMANWTPCGEGPGFEFSRILKAARAVSRRDAGPVRPRASQRCCARRRR